MQVDFSQFYILMFGILAGAFPFLVLGVLVATIIQRYAKHEWFTQFVKTNRFVSHFTIAIFGLFIPICECGNIPIIKKLMVKGFTLSQGVTFLLASPIVNPVTILTTFQAFPEFQGLVWFRILGGLAIAYSIGLIISTIKNPSQFMIPITAGEIEHTHKGIKSFAFHYVSEFTETFKMLFISAIIASLIQVIVPKETLLLLGTNPLLSLLVMIAFSFIISVCSNVDSFIALSFTGTFSNSSLLGFMVSGPMIDIKTVVMLKSLFTSKFILILTLLIFSFTIVLCLLYYSLNSYGIV